VLARFQIAGGKFPVLVRVVQALLQALALFVLRDVQQELAQHRAVLGQHALEIIDLGVALARLFGRDPAVDDRHQHIFVVAAVEKRHLAVARHPGVDAPEIVVCLLGFGRRFPWHGMNPQRAHFPEDVADRAVLAAGVGALQHDQQLEAPVGIEQVLELIEFGCERLGGGFID